MNDVKTQNTTATHTSGRANVYPYMLCALFAALTAVCTFINIPLPFTPIPINLATLSVFLAGGLLGPKYGSLSQIVYIFIGAIGIPVFSNFQGGIGVLAGPTGGYLVGYIVAALVVGLILRGLDKNANEKKATTLLVAKIVVACLAGMVTYFTLGTIWFMYLTNTGLWASLIACVFPFLLGDAVKITAATILILKLKKHIRLY